MLTPFLGQRAGLLSLSGRLKIPYLAFVSGIVIGVMAVLAFGTSENDHSVAVLANVPSVANTRLPSHRGFDALSAPPKQVSVFYYVVDSETKASVLSQAMNEATGAHENFVMMAKAKDTEWKTSLVMALEELTNAGVPVQVVDLRN